MDSFLTSLQAQFEPDVLVFDMFLVIVVFTSLARSNEQNNLILCRPLASHSLRYAQQIMRSILSFFVPSTVYGWLELLIMSFLITFALNGYAQHTSISTILAMLIVNTSIVIAGVGIASSIKNKKHGYRKFLKHLDNHPLDTKIIVSIGVSYLCMLFTIHLLEKSISGSLGQLERLHSEYLSSFSFFLAMEVDLLNLSSVCYWPLYVYLTVPCFYIIDYGVTHVLMALDSERQHVSA